MVQLWDPPCYKCLGTQRLKCSVCPTPNNFSNRQSLESRLSGLITSAKTHFEQTLCSQSSTEIFSYIKSLSSAPSVPPIVSLDDSTGSNDCDKVSLFNSFFHSVFTRSDFEIPPLEELPVATWSYFIWYFNIWIGCFWGSVFSGHI